MSSPGEVSRRMNDPSKTKTSISRRLWRLITRGWVAEVPEDIACCEFDCRELHCEHGQWETCEYRLRRTTTDEQRRPKDANCGNAE